MSLGLPFLILAALAALVGEPSVAVAAEDESQREAADLVTAVLVFGLSGIAAVALVGTALLFAGRRQSAGTEPPTTDAGPQHPDPEPPRRSTSQRGTGLSEDPIVASMGIGKAADAEPAGRVASQSSGRAERPRQRGRARPR